MYGTPDADNISGINLCSDQRIIAANVQCCEKQDETNRVTALAQRKVPHRRPRPEGAKQYSPGQRPGKRASRDRALKGRNTTSSRVPVSPFQGSVRRLRKPRALPWAVLSQPF